MKGVKGRRVAAEGSLNSDQGEGSLLCPAGVMVPWCVVQRSYYNHCSPVEVLLPVLPAVRGCIGLSTAANDSRARQQEVGRLAGGSRVIAAVTFRMAGGGARLTGWLTG